MKIRRIILKNVRNFVDFDYTFEDSWTGEIPEALLLIGPNGSGKTTILDSIAELWRILPEFLEIDNGDKSKRPNSNITESAGLAAIEIVGFKAENLWLYSADGFYSETPPLLQNFLDAYSQSFRIGYQNVFELDHENDAKMMRRERGFAAPGMGFREFYEYGSLDVFTSEHRWIQDWRNDLTENIFGKRKDLPNLVYLESDARRLLPVEERFSVQTEPEEYRWLARYEPTTSRKGSLHNYLYNLKVVDERAFQQIVDQVNDFMSDKNLNGFDRRTGDLLVKLQNGKEHSINNLSSGEKQVLLMLATITRWFRPGGIVLIDEPDLHLHPTLTTAFVAHLRRMIKEKGGQLIIASHATELWQDFTESHRVELGRLSEVA